MRATALPVRPEYTARAGEPILVFRDDDGSFAIGCGRITVATDDVAFVNDVARDLAQLAHLREGDAVLREGDATGRAVRIRKPEPPTRPPNGWTMADDIAAATAFSAPAGIVNEDDDSTIIYHAAPAPGATVEIVATAAGSDSTIVYDPSDWPRCGDPHSPPSSEILLRLLRQANLNAAGKANKSGGGFL